MICVSRLKPSWVSMKQKMSSRISSTTKDLKSFLRIFSYSSPRDRALLAISTVASACAGATLPLMNLLFARLIETFTSLTRTSQNNISDTFKKVINQYVLYVVYLFIGRLFLSYIAIIGFRITSLRVSANIRLYYLQALFRQPISTLDALPPGQMTAIITITANVLQLGISERLSSLIQAIAVIVIALIIGCIFSWELTLVTATGLVAIVIWYQLITPAVVKRYAEIQKVETEAAGVAAEALTGIRMIAACGAETKMSKSYGQLVEKVEEMSRKLSPLLSIQHSPVFFATYATFALCFWFAMRLYMQAEFVDIKTLVVVLMSVLTMLAHISSVSIPLTAAYNSISAANIFFSIIDAPVASTAGLKNEEVQLQADIVLENVNFAYPLRHEVKVLNGLTLNIPSGKTTAIVGPSGSGKSTIIAIIQRWYELGGTDPIASFLRNGTVKIGEKNLNEVDLNWWRSRIGFVQQEPTLFNDSIFKNVEYGLVGTKWEFALSEVKQQLVVKACQEAYADDFIRRLPEGYHTNVGNMGLQLSGGQRQRIAIARAIVRQPDILIFDEATSALDVASERIVQTALNRAAENRTTIIIAHRLSTIKDADQIVVVAKGSVVQQGTHDSLLQQEGSPYWKLVNVQQLNMQTENRNSTSRVQNRSEQRQSVLVSYPSNIEPSATEKQPTDGKTAEKAQKSPSVMKSFASLLFEQRKHAVGYLTIIIAAIGAASSTPLQAYLFGSLISSFSLPIDRLLGSINFLCLMLLLVAVGIGLSYVILGWVSNNISVKTVAFYRKDYFQNIINKRIPYFDDLNNSAGLLTARLATDPAQLQQLLGTNMAMALISIFGLIGCIVVALLFHWRFALVVMISSLPIVLAGGWYRVRHEIEFENRNNKVFAESASFATEAIGAIRTVASLTLERVVCHKYQDLLEGHIVQSWRRAQLSSLFFAASDSMVLLCMAFALWYGGMLLANFEIAAFNFLVVYLAIIQGSLSAGQWLSFGPNVAQVSAAADRIQSVRCDKSDQDITQSNKFWEKYRWEIPASLLWKGADIEFRNVNFTFPNRDLPVLYDFSMTVRHGQFAAIVGPSGSGKTTAIALLERFYEPDRGSIYFNEENIADMPLQVLRKRMSLVAQEPYLFRGTIRENILLGMETSAVDERQFYRACHDCGIHDFIASLPEGYDTDIGTGGVLLSGGQKQRISIARALIRNPSVLLLDEATSSLDSASEKQIQTVFERSGKGRTMIVVAHRLATIQKADMIVVLDQGRIVEQGSHDYLLRRRGMYWQMCQNQNLGV